MNKKILFLMISCLVIFIACSAEDVNNFNSKPVTVADPDPIINPDTIAKPGNTDGSGNTDNSPIVKNIIIAHRGAWKKKDLPQNSIASLKEAIRLKCKGSEFDIVLTSDDSLVVCHDSKYNDLVVQNSKYADLVVLKLPNGEKISTLQEYILASKENNYGTLLFCELKNYGLNLEKRKKFVAKTLAIVKSLNAEKSIVYTSFDYNLLKLVRAANATADLQYISGDISPEQLKNDNISGAVYQIDIFKNHPEWILSARQNNITLNVWTVNDSSNINWFLKNNFDSIVTDEPELALSLSIQ